MKFLKTFLFVIILFFIGNITFVQASTATITFSKTGSGSGVIKSDLTGNINCGTVCSKEYNLDYSAGSHVSVSAVPDEGSIFMGWSGFGKGTNVAANRNQFSLYVYQDLDVVAQFDKVSVGDIKITTNPDGTLQATFDASFNNGEAITGGGYVYGLTANPTGGWTADHSISGSGGLTPTPTPTLTQTQTKYSFSSKISEDNYLKPNTTYHIRSVLGYTYLDSNGKQGQNIYGKDISFTTGLPDLSSVLDTYPVSTDYGMAEVAVNVSNTGNYFAKEPFNVLVEQSSLADGGGTIKAIGAGGTDIFYTLFDSYLYVNKSIGQGTLQYGLYGKSGDTVSIRSCIDQTFSGDTKGVITESDENNNCSAWHNVLIKRVPSISLTNSKPSGEVGINPVIGWIIYSDSPLTSCVSSGDWPVGYWPEPTGTYAYNVWTSYQLPNPTWKPEYQSVGPLNVAGKYNYGLTCTNSSGSGSSMQTVTVTAQTATLTVVTGPIASKTQTTAWTSVTTGGVDALQAGIVWGTTNDPKVFTNQGINTAGNKSGLKPLEITGLIAGNTYHVRAYGNISATATADASYIYGDDVTFTATPTPTLTVATGPITAFAQTTATSSVETGGGVDAIDAGIVWSTTETPRVGTNQSGINTAGNASGFKSLGMTLLTPNTTYYVQAYGRTQAVHGVDGPYTYGDQVTFKTSALTSTLTVVTGPIASKTQTNAWTSVTTGGGVDALQAGIVWGTTLKPKVSSNMSVRNTGGWKSGTVPLEMTELNAGTLYHVRAYGNISATDTTDASYIYGADVTFVTSAAINTGIWKDGTCPTTCGYLGGEIKQVCTGGNSYCTGSAPDPTICPAVPCAGEDKCDNLAGVQIVVPPGYTVIGTTCTKNPPKIIEI